MYAKGAPKPFLGIRSGRNPPLDILLFECHMQSPVRLTLLISWNLETTNLQNSIVQGGKYRSSTHPMPNHRTGRACNGLISTIPAKRAASVLAIWGHLATSGSAGRRGGNRRRDRSGSKERGADLASLTIEMPAEMRASLSFCSTTSRCRMPYVPVAGW
jgi:hypothetical protein